MAVIKVIELMAESKKGFEDAADIAVKKASKSLQNIRSVYIKDLSATVKNGKIATYRATCKISFEVK